MTEKRENYLEELKFSFLPDKLWVLSIAFGPCCWWRRWIALGRPIDPLCLIGEYTPIKKKENRNESPTKIKKFRKGKHTVLMIWRSIPRPSRPVTISIYAFHRLFICIHPSDDEWTDWQFQFVFLVWLHYEGTGQRPSSSSLGIRTPLHKQVYK